MKIIQLNLWQGRLLRQAVDFLREENPDIICLQEVYSLGFRHSAFDYLTSFQIIQELFPDYDSYYSPAYDVAVLDTDLGVGNAIFSRYPLSDKETFPINGEYARYETAAALSEQNNRRNLQRVMVHPESGKPFCVLNHHAFWDKDPLGTEVSLEKMQKVADIAKASPRPLILCGDLNLKAESPVMEPLLKILRSLTKENHLKTTLSSVGKVSDVACDHICVSEGVEVRSFHASDTLVSDHLALIMEFDIEP